MEGKCLLEVLTPCKALLVRALTLGVSRGFVTRRPICLAAPYQALTHPVDKAGKRRLDGYLLPITLPVTVGLGENAIGALNALVPAPASGGGRRPCARSLSTRMSQFPIQMV